MSMFGSIRGTWWHVWCPERGQEKGDNRMIVAHSAEAAARAWAERDDAESADYSIVGGNDATVMVAEDREEAKEECFVVSGESCPVYRTRQGPNVL